jgi:hypothetical protein
MVSVLASSAVYRGFKPRSGQTKDYKKSVKKKRQHNGQKNLYKIGICYREQQSAICHHIPSCAQ